MNIKKQICDAFCSGVSIRELKMGYAIASPFEWVNGDRIQFYVRVDGNLVRIEDSGSIFFDLEAAGVDMSNSNRRDILGSLAHEFGINYDDSSVLFHSDWFDKADIGKNAINFVSFLHRVQDLLFTTRDRAENTFKIDLINELQRRFGAEAEISLDGSPIEALEYYSVDIVVKHKSGKTAAIFPGTTEQKALEAVLFAKEVELKRVENIIPFLVFERSDAPKINKNTRAKALNSELQLAAWDGGARDVMDKVAKRVSAT